MSVTIVIAEPLSRASAGVMHAFVPPRGVTRERSTQGESVDMHQLPIVFRWGRHAAKLRRPWVGEGVGPVSPDVESQLFQSTKIAVPRPRHDDLVRERLLSRLPAHSTAARVTEIVAPAGWGKSTLLYTWLDSLPEDAAVAYINVDDDDDHDPSHFLAYLQAAIEASIPDVAGTPTANGPAWVDQVAERLQTSDQRLLMVFDDLHRLRSNETHQLVRAMVERFPVGSRFVIAARTDPPLELARLRAQRGVEEIRAADLALDVIETDQLLQQCFAVELLPDDLVTLADKTEGWPAAVSLAGLSLRREADPGVFVSEFAGTNRLVFDYLTEELLTTLGDDVRGFMTATSLLEEFCAPLCVAVCGRPDAGELLRRLERNSAFVISLDRNGTWYRYHHLVADRLQAELTDLEQRRVLHRRAAEWLTDNGRERAAIKHLLSARDFNLAAELIGQIGYEYVVRGRYRTVVGWVEALPIGLVERHVELAVVAGLAALFLQDFVGAWHWVELARRQELEPAQQLSVLSLEGNLLHAEGRLTSLLEISDRIEALAAEVLGATHASNQDPLLAEALITPTLARLLGGDLDHARRVADLILISSKLPAAMGPATVAHGVIGLIDWHQGDTAAARRRVASAERASADGRLDRLSFHRVVPMVVAGMVGTEQQRTVAADFFAELGDLNYSKWGVAYGLLAEANHEFRQGRVDEAQRALSHALETVDGQVEPSPILLENIARLRDEIEETGESVPVAPDPASLTDRELQILRALAGNLTQREIGREFYLAFNTVKGYARSAYRKLGVNSRTEAVERCRELGLI